MAKSKTIGVSVGRTVRYVISGAEVRAAVVAAVHDEEAGVVDLSVMKAAPGDLVNHPSVLAGSGTIHPVALLGGVGYDEKKGPGTWHWPQGQEEGGGK